MSEPTRQEPEAVQIKKNPNDPNVEDINPDIVALAKRLQFVKGPFELFLRGELTWLEALETMIMLLGKEYVAQNRILITTLTDLGPTTTMLVGSSGELFKALPPSPINHDEPAQLPLR